MTSRLSLRTSALRSPTHFAYVLSNVFSYVCVVALLQHRHSMYTLLCFGYHTSHQATAGILVAEPALAWEATVPSAQLGVHVDNRNGALASLRQALVTGAKHCKAGYSYM